MRIAIAIGVLATLLTVGLLIWFLMRHRVEGFATKAEKAEKAVRVPDVNNVLLKLMAQVKRTMGYISNPADWIERIQMSKMTPGELARRYIASTAEE